MTQDAENDAADRQAKLDQIMEGLSSLRDDFLIDEVRHRSLSDILGAARDELERLEAFFRDSMSPTAQTRPIDAQVRSARSALVRSSASICRSLGDFENSMSRHPLKDHRVVRDAFSWVLDGLMEELEKFAKAIKMNGWSLGVTAGVPFGVSFSISFSFA